MDSSDDLGHAQFKYGILTLWFSIGANFRQVTEDFSPETKH